MKNGSKENDDELDDKIWHDDIVAVNNIPRDELLNNNLKVIERKWDEGIITDKHLEVGILPCKKGETITIEYTKGTAYKKAECPAEVRAFYAENDKVESLPLKLVKEGYAVVDTTDLEKGLHCINGAIFEIA